MSDTPKPMREALTEVFAALARKNGRTAIGIEAENYAPEFYAMLPEQNITITVDGRPSIGLTVDEDGGVRLFTWDDEGEIDRQFTLVEPRDTEDLGEYVSTCPACGSPIDYCQGHGEIGDPNGHLILEMHDAGDHSACHEDGDCDA